MNPRISAHYARPGNQNAAKGNGAKSAFHAFRCKKSDKAIWVRAANRADRRGELEGEKTKGAQSVLTAWVIRTLNQAARADEISRDGGARR